MLISDILNENLVIVPLTGESKKEIIEKLVNCLAGEKKILNPSLAIASVLEREQIMTTGIGKGVAIPHGKYPDINEVALCIGIVPDGVDFASLDEQPAHIVALLLTPENEPTRHIKLLSKISRLLNNAACRSDLVAASSPREIISVIKHYESED